MISVRISTFSPSAVKSSLSGEPAEPKARTSTRVLREDIVNPDLLYVGTEFAAFASLNRGGAWLKLNGKALPSLSQLIVIALACRKRPESLIEGIIAPTREQLGLRLDAETSRLLYEITSLVARGAATNRGSS